MLFLICVLAIWLRCSNYIDISWFILIPCLIVTILMGICELLLIWKELKPILLEKKLDKENKMNS